MAGNEDMGGRFQLSRLVADAEIGSRIYMQAIKLQPKIYMADERAGDFLVKLADVMKKLERAKYHLDRCVELVRASISNPAAVDGVGIHSDQTTGVEAEVEAFLMQAKSCLDLLVKLLEPVAGLRVSTFGDKGAKVVNQLTRNLPASAQPRAQLLVKLIDDDQHWLGPVIQERDTVAHYRALWSTGVRSASVDGRTAVQEPSDRNGVPFTKQLSVIYFNLLTFCEDFVALSLHLAMPPQLSLRIVAESERASVDVAKYELVPVGLRET